MRRVLAGIDAAAFHRDMTVSTAILSAFGVRT